MRFAFMNETFQLIKFILKWLGEEFDIFLSSPKCQNVDDLFWATTATILVLPVIQLPLFICIYLGGGCFPFNHPVCRSGWFGIGKSSLLFIQPSLRMSWTMTSTACFIQQTGTLFLFQVFVTIAPPPLFCLLMCVYMSWLSGKHPPAMDDTWVWLLSQKDPPGEGNGNPHQYSCLGNHMDRRAWQATVQAITKSQTWLNDSTTTNNK